MSDFKIDETQQQLQKAIALYQEQFMLQNPDCHLGKMDIVDNLLPTIL